MENTRLSRFIRIIVEKLALRGSMVRLEKFECGVSFPVATSHDQHPPILETGRVVYLPFGVADIQPLIQQTGPDMCKAACLGIQILPIRQAAASDQLARDEILGSRACAFVIKRHRAKGESGLCPFRRFRKGVLALAGCSLGVPTPYHDDDRLIPKEVGDPPFKCAAH
jgi:hypothetical protein